MKIKKISVKRLSYPLLSLLLVAASFIYVINPASAASLTNTYVRLNRMAANPQTTSFRLVFKAYTSQTANVTIDFTSAWTAGSGSVNATQSVSTTQCVTDGYNALPATGSLAASGSGTVVTISSTGATTAGTTYCVDLTSASAVTNPSAGEYYPVVSHGSDTTTVAVRTVSTGYDQIVVSATVPPTFNFALDGTTDSFASNLSAGSIGVTSGRTITVNTNATNGWFAWASDLNTGLDSTSASYTIDSTTPGTGATLSAGTEGYVFGITNITQGSGGGTTTAAAAYTSNGTSTGSGLDTAIRQIASSDGTADDAVLTVKELAAISATTPAGTDYTDTITIIGAGYF